MPSPIAAILDNRAFGILMRVVVTFPFWAAGLAKIADFNATLAEMAMFNLQPAAVIAVATIITQITGSALVIHGRHAWLGAGWLAVFTLLTIPLVHAFWRFQGEEAVVHMHVAVEHIGMCAGLALAAVQAHWVRTVRDETVLAPRLAAARG
ncbi:DoxX family protein [Muricoccus radiodurans]|uniref:DoxX family protein n=1 Tax=Muricoccus radiodurans TaxID=2231721 RepID=UPI003CF20C63